MYKNKTISIILCLLMVYCGGNSTPEVAGSSVSTDTSTTTLDKTPVENETQAEQGLSLIHI